MYCFSNAGECLNTYTVSQYTGNATSNKQLRALVRRSSVVQVGVGSGRSGVGLAAHQYLQACHRKKQATAGKNKFWQDCHIF